jgi:putative heme-binding domain-containing protein
MLEHALINALRSIGSLDAFRTALVHPNPQVQKAALLLLDQAPHRTLTANDVLAHLASANAPLRQVARFRLAQHIEWAPAAAEFVREHLLAPVLAPEDERTMAELLLAFQDAAPFATLVADALAQPDTVVGIPGKVLLLDFLAKTTRTPWPDIWTANLHSALAHSENSVRLSAIHAVASAQTDAWDSALERIAANTAESAELRVEALSVLARRSPDLSPPAWHFLLSQLATANPFLTRIRAAEVLASARPPPETLRRFISAAAADPSISPTLVLSSVQRAGLDASTTVLLLPYLERCVRRGYPLNEAEAEQVIRAAPVRGLESVESLRHAVQEQARVRQALFQQYRPLLTGGHPTRGRDLFFDKAGCHACHQVGTEGRAAGPDLTKLGAIRSPDDILESVLLPSATLAQGYDTFVAELANGDTITGNLVGETEETVTLRNATGIEARILRGQIDSLERSPLSLMPEGLLQALTEQEAADLLAFLLDLR